MLVIRLTLITFILLLSTSVIGQSMAERAWESKLRTDERMAMNRGDTPAQPVTTNAMCFEGKWVAGITIRERMAMAAMQGLLASGKFQVNDEMAKEAWDAADALLFMQTRTGDDNE